MLPNDPVTALTPEVAAWRRHIHAKPELGFQEHETAHFIVGKLRGFGLEVAEGIGGTGVVGIRDAVPAVAPSARTRSWTRFR